MELRYLLEELPDAQVDGDPGVILEGIHCDSRRVGLGDLFVAVRGGQEEDRHLYVGDAVARGARAVVVEDEVNCGGATRVQVADCRTALARLSARFFDFPSQHMLNIGITGTNGKTTTAFLLRSVLEAAGLSCGYVGTLGCRIDGELQQVGNTTPEAAELHRLLRLMVDRGKRAVVLEVSSHGLALKRVEGIPFHAAVFSNLTRDHLDFHGTWEQYFAVKAQLFENMPEDGVAVVNLDDPMAAKLIRRTRARVLTYGYDEAAQVRLRQVEPAPSGAILSFDTPLGVLTTEAHLAGGLNHYNTMAALATGLALELDPRAVCGGVASLKNVPGRFERIAEGQNFEVIVDYAHTPDALQRVLQSAREMGARRLICVFGCGGDRDCGKRALMGEVAGELAELTVLTSDNPRSEDPTRIIADIAAGVAKACEFHSEVDREQAIGFALAEARKGDIVVIAGKGHESTQELSNSVISFDDREVARRALRLLLAGERRP